MVMGTQYPAYWISTLLFFDKRPCFVCLTCPYLNSKMPQYEDSGGSYAGGLFLNFRVAGYFAGGPYGKS